MSAISADGAAFLTMREAIEHDLESVNDHIRDCANRVLMAEEAAATYLKTASTKEDMHAMWILMAWKPQLCTKDGFPYLAKLRWGYMEQCRIIRMKERSEQSGKESRREILNELGLGENGAKGAGNLRYGQSKRRSIAEIVK